jgi:hypothetical protein
MTQPDFLKKPTEDMTPAQWESICDGCGLCCQMAEIDEETEQLVMRSNIACRYLCLDSHRCKDYENRHINVPECMKVTPENIHGLTWLPHTCGYRLVALKMDLPSWHHLLCGNRDEVHISGPSMRGGVVSEDDDL